MKKIITYIISIFLYKFYVIFNHICFIDYLLHLGQSQIVCFFINLPLRYDPIKVRIRDRACNGTGSEIHDEDLTT